MPAVRFSRDKRGYEYVYLVHTPTRRGKPGRTRVLYWYRTPPGVRIGRKPFDDEVRRTLERQNPGVTFDWEAIVATPMPPPDMTEFWRERRRLEKAARQERRAAELEESARTESDLSAIAPASAPDAIDSTDGESQAAGSSAELTTDASRRRRRRRRRRTAGEPEEAKESELSVGLDAAADDSALEGSVELAPDLPAEAVSDPVEPEPEMEAPSAPGDSASEVRGRDSADGGLVDD